MGSSLISRTSSKNESREMSEIKACVYLVLAE